MSTTAVCPKGLGAAAMFAASRRLAVDPFSATDERWRAMLRPWRARWIVLGEVFG